MPLSHILIVVRQSLSVLHIRRGKRDNLGFRDNSPYNYLKTYVVTHN